MQSIVNPSRDYKNRSINSNTNGDSHISQNHTRSGNNSNHGNNRWMPAHGFAVDI